MTNTQNTEEWEERFDEELHNFPFAVHRHYLAVKSFIRRERATAYKQGQEESRIKWYETGLKEGRGDFESGIKQAREEGYEQGLGQAQKEKEALVKEVMEAVEGMKMDETYLGKPEHSSQIGYNQALSDTLSTLREIALKAGVKIK